MTAYRGYLSKVNEAFESMVNDIDVIYNFDHGDEFEIVLCKAFRKILPRKYGIVRGHVITKDGMHAGDDIIIYDCVRFPSLRLLESEGFGQKQFIPVEAVYAYVEAKNTLSIHDEGGKKQNFYKACEQVRKVKSLPREPVLPSSERAFWPDRLNPLYGVVWSRKLAYPSSHECQFSKRHRRDEDTCCLKHDCSCEPDEFGYKMDCCCEQLHETLEDHCALIGGIPDQLAPDLIVAGSDYVALPCIHMKEVYSPFFLSKKSLLTSIHCDKKAFGIGVTNLLWALDSITLGSIDWGYVLSRELPGVTQPPSRV